MKEQHKSIIIPTLLGIMIVMLGFILVIQLRKPKIKSTPDVIAAVNRVQQKIDSSNLSIAEIDERIAQLQNRKDTTIENFTTITKTYSNERNKIDTATDNSQLLLLEGYLASYAKRRKAKGGK